MGMKAIKDLLQRIRTDRKNRQGTWIGIDESHIILNALEKSERIETENAELRARLDRAVELPRIIHPNPVEWHIQYQYESGIITEDIRFSEAEAEARLKELKEERDESH